MILPLADRFNCCVGVYPLRRIKLKMRRFIQIINFDIKKISSQKMRWFHGAPAPIDTISPNLRCSQAGIGTR